jgi:hypothetical protein
VYNDYSQIDKKLKYTSEHKEVNQTHLQESNTLDDDKCKDDPTNKDDAFKNSSNLIGLTAISNDPRIRSFFTKTYSVVDIYCKRNRLSKRKLCSAIISEIY